MSMFGLNGLKVVAIDSARKPAVEKKVQTSGNLTKLISGILGAKAEGPTEFELHIEVEMEAIAKQENGEYDKEENCVIFGSDESPFELTVYAFIEENEDDAPEAPDQYVNYQAVIRCFEPNRLYAGELFANFKEAVASAGKLLK